LSAVLLAGFACTKEPENVPLEVFDSTRPGEVMGKIPFASEPDLLAYSAQGECLDFRLVRKIAFLELEAGDLVREFGWTSYRLYNQPVVIYDMASRPKYYEYLVLDGSDRHPIGMLRAYAQRARSTVVRSVSDAVADYAKFITNDDLARGVVIYEDWQSNRYTAQKGEIGKPVEGLRPLQPSVKIINREPSKEEIANAIATYWLPELSSFGSNCFDGLSTDWITRRPGLAHDIELAKKMTAQSIRDSLFLSLKQIEGETTQFWSSVDRSTDKILALDEAKLLRDNMHLTVSLREILPQLSAKGYTIP
jgi:hypothetical protein